jgi:ABC-type lipoprotein export system ATPase subunit
VIIVSSLIYQYEAGKKVLSFPDLLLEDGATCLLLGNSGSGKTTLLHLMGGLLKVQQGKIKIQDQDLSQMTETQLDRFRAQHIGFIFQRNHLISALSVRKNLLLSPFLANIGQDEKRLDELLARFQLEEKKDARVSLLSQGEAQRVAIARAVMNKPDVLFADEPTSALDDENCDRVIQLLLQVAKENGCTLVIATHDQRLRAVFPTQIRLGDR